MAKQDEISSDMIKLSIKESMKNMQTFSKMRSMGIIQTGSKRPCGVQEGQKLSEKKFRNY
jgi:hypothetical protein